MRTRFLAQPTQLIRAVHPRRGLRLRRISLTVAQEVDRLFAAKLVDWEQEDGITHITLTRRGRASRFNYTG
jgi:hypothetical protein